MLASSVLKSGKLAKGHQVFNPTCDRKGTITAVNGKIECGIRWDNGDADSFTAKQLELNQIEFLSTKKDHRIELRERLDILDAKIRELDSRLLAVKTPGRVLLHAESLEKLAEEIFDRAQRIRQSLQLDSQSWESLHDELTECQLEANLIRYCLQHGIVTARKVDLRMLVRTALETMGDK